MEQAQVNEPTESTKRKAEESELLPPSKKISKACENENAGIVDFISVENDSSDRSMILLTGLRTIFQKQLPNMPKEYIARLVYDKAHVAMIVVRLPYTVLGGITYRPFVNGGFAEIVFCAIDTTCQVQGYGSRLMAHVKDYVGATYNARHFLTYADNYAIGYFKKQGFTTDITLEKEKWMGYIKDYEGGTIMQCTVIDKVKYLDAVSIVAAQRWAVFKKIADHTLATIVYPGIDFGDRKSIDPSEIPGLKEAGWLPNASHLSSRPQPRQRGPLYLFMKKLLAELQENTHSWPFVEPVAGVADYYDIIKNPMGKIR